jgi:hypothetical protein
MTDKPAKVTDYHRALDMTNAHHKAARDLDEEKQAYADQLLESAAKWNLLRDTGKRKWSERTRSYQIVWEAVPGKCPSDWDAWRKFQGKQLQSLR